MKDSLLCENWPRETRPIWLRRQGTRNQFHSPARRQTPHALSGSACLALQSASETVQDAHCSAAGLKRRRKVMVKVLKVLKVLKVVKAMEALMTTLAATFACSTLAPALASVPGVLSCSAGQHWRVQTTKLRLPRPLLLLRQQRHLAEINAARGARSTTESAAGNVRGASSSGAGSQGVESNTCAKSVKRNQIGNIE